MTQINQDELLLRIEGEWWDENDVYHCTLYYNLSNALRKVAILHKLKIDMNGYGSCEECSRTAYYNVPWPCNTIKEIAEEIYA